MLVRNDIVQRKETERYLVQGTPFRIDLPSFVVRLGIPFCLSPCILLCLHVFNFKLLRSSFVASRGIMWWKALCSPLGVGTSSCLPVSFFPFGVNTSRVVTVDVLLGDFSH